MDILQAARQLRPGTAWSVSGSLNSASSVLTQAEDATTRVAIPTPAELQPVMDSDTTPAAITAVQRAGALTQFLSDPAPTSKLERAILLVILDEVNVIRALLPGPPAPRTITQFRAAVQAKINAGAAD